MPNETRNFVAILPNGTESNHEIHWETNNTRWNDSKIRSIAEAAVRDAGLTTPRNSAGVTVPVKVHPLEIRKGQLVRGMGTTFNVVPPLARMTDDDYNRELNEALNDLPDEFRDFISQRAYEDGHSAGYEEIVNLARSLATDLKPAVDKYTKRLKIKS